jgi:hypothetical protein
MKELRSDHQGSNLLLLLKAVSSRKFHIIMIENLHDGSDKAAVERPLFSTIEETREKTD